jgi:hypothetical protein
VEESKFPLIKENKDEQVKILTMFLVFSDKKKELSPQSLFHKEKLSTMLGVGGW